MKVQVSPDLCAGFSACLGVAPEVFELHDNGYAVARVVDVPPELEDAVREAAAQCPTGAISISEDGAE
jgi:ferredoxin